MSAAGAYDKRSLFDNYPTPDWAIDRFFDRVSLPVGRWLAVSAGAGNILRRARAHPRTAARVVSCTAVELDRTHEPQLVQVADRAIFGDFLQVAPTLDRHDCCVDNPPYELTLPFIQAALPLVGVLALLLRHNFLESAERLPFWRKNMPDVYVLPNRPTFIVRAKRVHTKTGDWIEVTTNDSCGYAWFVWRAREMPRAEGRVVVLDDTPDDVRAAARAVAPVLLEELDGSVVPLAPEELRRLLEEQRLAKLEIQRRRRAERKLLAAG